MAEGTGKATTEQVLKITDLRIESIHGLVLVDNVSLELKRGEVLGLIGESGAGKSTIGLGAMAYSRGGCRITGGKVEIDGVSIRDLSAEGRREMRGRRIAYIAQSAAASFNPAHKIIDQVIEMPVKHGIMSKTEAKAWALELFRALDLPKPEIFGERYPHQVSGGQLQRAMTAMAMSCRPDIMVFDEPTTALDVTTQATILRLMRRLSDERGAAMILISHDLGVVAQLCDTVQVMYASKTVERGPALEVLTRPRHRYTEALLRSVVRRDRINHGPLPSIPGVPPNLRELPLGCPFEPRCHVGHGRTECLTSLPASRGFASEHGSVTAKCHFPAGEADDAQAYEQDGALRA